MSLKVTEVHKNFKLNGIHFNSADLHEVAYSLIKEGEDYEHLLGDFLMDWLADEPTITVKTSGSTGIPKTIRLKKEHMINSARMTGGFFGLGPGTTALLCLPAYTIAARMMLVRAMILGWELDMVRPSSSPLSQVGNSYDFCAMVPLQLTKSLAEIDRVGTLLVGGAAVPPETIKQLSGMPVQVYESYGMTETCSHIALKEIHTEASSSKKEKNFFRTLDGVALDIDDRGCLVIKAPALADQPLVTNDLVELISPTEFSWLGRWDYVINSGGVKLIPEMIEKKLGSLISQRIVVTGQTDKELGEKLVLVVEGEIDKKELSAQIKDSKMLDAYEKPREIYSLANFPETTGGKADRMKILQSINKAG